MRDGGTLSGMSRFWSPVGRMVDAVERLTGMCDTPTSTSGAVVTSGLKEGRDERSAVITAGNLQRWVGMLCRWRTWVEVEKGGLRCNRVFAASVGLSDRNPWKI